jgi:hypothetical protein
MVLTCSVLQEFVDLSILHILHILHCVACAQVQGFPWVWACGDVAATQFTRCAMASDQMAEAVRPRLMSTCNILLS